MRRRMVGHQRESGLKIINILLTLIQKKEYLYDIENDREEKFNLCEDSRYKEQLELYNSMVSDVYSQSTELIKDDRIWNWEYWIEY